MWTSIRFFKCSITLSYLRPPRLELYRVCSQQLPLTPALDYELEVSVAYLGGDYQPCDNCKNPIVPRHASCPNLRWKVGLWALKYVRISRAVEKACFLRLPHSQSYMLAAMMGSILHSRTMQLQQLVPAGLHLIRTLRWWVRLQEPHQPLKSRGTLLALGLCIPFCAVRKLAPQGTTPCRSSLSHSKKSPDEHLCLALLARSLPQVTLWPCPSLVVTLPHSLEDREPIAE